MQAFFLGMFSSTFVPSFDKSPFLDKMTTSHSLFRSYSIFTSFFQNIALQLFAPPLFPNS
jgi:hypothetical protein